jgi:magnesium-transporting ATPase (P-type)
MAAQGERVLGLAWLPDAQLKAGSLGPADLPKNLILLGLVGLIDPPRQEAIEAVKECHAGGIRVTMITGDHKITVAAIAKMLDIGDGKTAITILSMLPTNVAQALVILVAILVGFTAPITAPQILWVNMVTSVALGLVISFEPHELDVMRRPPRAVDRPILDSFGVWRVVFVGTALLVLTLWAFFWMKSQDASDPLARTVAVNALVIGQVFYLLKSRFKIDSSLSPMAHLGNPYLPAGIGAVVILQLLYTYAPPLQSLFETENVPLRVWPWLFLGGLIFFLVVEAEKAIIRAMRPREAALAAVAPA